MPSSIIDGASDRTIEFFLRPRADNRNAMTILCGGNAGDPTNTRIVLNANPQTFAPTDSISWFYYDTDAGATRAVTWVGLELRIGAAIVLVRDPFSRSIDFTHIALTRNQFDDVFELFIDGQSAGIKATNDDGDRVSMTNISVDANGLVIGQRFYNVPSMAFVSDEYYQGYMDEFAIFDSVVDRSVIITHARDKSLRYHVGSRIPASDLVPTFTDL